MVCSCYFVGFCIVLFVFFFKQKTAYEMRISDWSSDVCSSDLGDATPFFIRSSRYDRHEFMTTSETNGPLWTQDQAIAYEAALEAINDVIAGYSAQIAIERNASPPNIHRIDRKSVV